MMSTNWRENPKHCQRHNGPRVLSPQLKSSPMANNTFDYEKYKGIQKNKKYYFLSFVKNTQKQKGGQKRADHVNNVDSTINMHLLLG